MSAGTLLPAGFSEAQVAAVAAGTAMAVAPDGRIFVCEKTGALRVIENNILLPTPFITLTVDSAGERGLIGICLDPDFSTNHYLYLYHTVGTAPIHNQVSRFTANGNVALAGSELVLADLDNLSSATNHNGGALHFGPDGKLYVAVGENATMSNSQTLANRLGKILRINADAANSIPTDNPFYSTATGLNRSIWALGLRNPFTFAFHHGSGRLFINDVGGNGPTTTEEVNDGIAGANYGWPQTEGDFAQASFPTLTRPFHAYNSGLTSDCAIVGGSFYDPTVVQFPAAYQDLYFFGDYCGGWIHTLNPATPEPATTTVGAQVFATGTGMLVDIAVDRSNGSLLYYRADGTVMRISYTGGSSPTPSPALTATLTLTAITTATVTATPTWTLTASISATPTATGSASPSPDASATATPSPSMTASPSATPSSPSLSPSATQSPTPSPSVTNPAVTPSVTPSITATVNVTLSPAATPPVSHGDVKVLDAVAWPQPNPRFLSVKLSAPAEKVRLLVYSNGSTRVKDLDLGPANAGWDRLALPANWHQGLAASLYFGHVEAWSGGQHDTLKKPLVLLLLR